MLKSKIVYFYKLEIKNSNKRDSINDCAEIMKDINSDNGNTIIIDDNKKIIIDIIELKKEHIYMTLGKQKPDSDYSLINRDLNQKEIIDKNNKELEWLQQRTYAVIWFEKGILGIVNSSGAPKFNEFYKFFNLNTKGYTFDMIAIPNEDTVLKIFDSKKPMINEITLDVPIPSSGFLNYNKLLKNHDDLIGELSANAKTVTITIKADKGESLIKECVKILQESIKGIKNKDGVAKIKAKPYGSNKLGDFNLYEDYYKFEIKVETDKKQDDLTISLGDETIKKNFFTALDKLYKENNILLSDLTDRV